MQSSPRAGRSLLLILTVIGSVSAAQATDVSVWLAPTGGYSTYAMDRVNDLIEGANRIFRQQFQLGTIEGGAAAGVELGADIATSVVVSVGYERLWGSSSGPSTEYNVGANVIELHAGYRPYVQPHLRFGFDLGIGAVLADGFFSVGPFKRSLSGAGPIFDGSLAAEYLPWTRVGFLARIGYRYALINEADLEASPPPPDPIDLDYSGLLLRGGVRVLLW